MTYSIYTIRNTVNDMRYIGLTNDLQRRCKEHFSKLKCDNHINRYLQFAYNKYGHESFLWEILETDIETVDSAKSQEVYWINHFGNTYNLTDGGDTPTMAIWAKTTVWNGIEYKSISDAARALGINRATMQERLSNGYTCDADMTSIPSHAIEMEWNGIIYPTIAHAARANDIPKRTMQGYHERDIHRTEDIPEVAYRDSIPFEWDGVIYESMSIAARELGVDAGLISQWYQRGWKSDKDRQEKDARGLSNRQKAIWNNTIYPSLKIAAAMLGVRPATLTRWLKNGWAKDSDIPKGYSSNRLGQTRKK